MKSILNFISGFIKKEEESKTEKIKEERSQIKIQMTENLRKINFTTIEINEVLNIISMAENKIEALKVRLIGSNIDNDDPMPFQQEILSGIRDVQVQMQADIKEKIREIQQRKLS